MSFAKCPSLSPWLRVVFVLVLGGSAALVAPPPAQASLVMALDLPTMAEEADRIVVGEVTSVKSDWDSQHKRILTTIEVKVAESWKGDMGAGGTLKIVQPGGSVGDIETRVHGLPTFAEGERAVLFLRGRAIGSLVGMGQGKRALRLDAETKRWMVQPGDRSAAVVKDAAGRLQPAPPEVVLPLEEMRSRVQSLLRTGSK